VEGKEDDMACKEGRRPDIEEDEDALLEVESVVN
jgi:hypothetical protein